MARNFDELIGRIDADIAANPKLKALQKKVNDGTATYSDAQAFAGEVARISGRVLKGMGFSEEDWRGSMESIMPAVMGENYDVITEYTQATQAALNKKAGLGLRVQVPDRDEDRVTGLVTYVTQAEELPQAKARAAAGVDNYGRHLVDESVRINARSHYRAGLQPKIYRRATGRCCKWCSDLAGSYDYGDEPYEVYQRHENCACIVEYDPADGRGQRQNVHSKKWSDASPEKVRERAAIGLQSDREADKIRLRKFIGLSANLEAITKEARGKDWVNPIPSAKYRIPGGFAAFPEGEKIRTHSMKIKPEEGFFDVAMHGGVTGVGFGTDKLSMDARELAKVIKRDPHYSGQPIRLLSCNTGLDPGNGDYCVAEELANALGVKVMAPDGILSIHSDGQFEIVDTGSNKLTPFMPNQRRRLK